MRNYIEIVLKKEKKPASLEKIVKKIEGLKSDELGKEVFLTDAEKEEVRKLLEEGVLSLDFYKTPSDNYILLSKTSFRKGRFYGDRTGAGRVSIVNSGINKDGKIVITEEKVGITKERVNGAVDGDYVLIDLGGKNDGPRVERVLDRNLDFIPGEVYRLGNSYFVKPIDKRKQGITIALSGPAIEGERVLVRLDHMSSDEFYVGEIVRTFNHKDDPNEDILWEAFKHGIDSNFSNESLEQLEHIPDEITDKDKIGREDLTDWEIFTIDGSDTKDMDDAISCTINKKGNYELGVHITDVASIVPFDSALDKDAFSRGNSYYLGGTVIPMFPHKVSNGIGSLNPYVERLTISCIVEINPEGEIVNYRLSPTVIKSQLKMTYEDVNSILKDGKVPEGYEEHVETLRRMSKLALILRKKRLNRGAVEFERCELKTGYDEEGHAKLGVRYQDVAENLIEEFMLVANETVDKELSRRGLPCVHRIHDVPNEEKIEAFLNFLEVLNLPYTDSDASTLASDRGAYQKLVEHISKNGGRLSELLTTEAIKCMSRAKYSTMNIGHYGLGKDNYCHFTSPIRRYSDLTDHRIIWDCIFDKGDITRNVRKWSEKSPEIAERCSHTERVADDCERDVTRMLCAEYMESHIGEEFEGTVTYVSGDCLTVQLDNMIEGTVRVRDLKGDYVHSPESFSLVSLDGFDNYFVGDRLRLKLERASKIGKTIDFSVVEKINETQINNSQAINTKVKIKGKNERTKRLLGTN